MYLNYDCLRDVLLVLERRLLIVEKPDFLLGGDCMRLSFSCVSLEELMADDDIVGYSKADVFYCIHNLEQAGYITAYIEYAGDCIQECIVTDITYSGHMFLRNVSDSTIWSAVKEKLGPGLNAALPVVFDLAGKLIAKGMGLQ